jgi:hypothetical protein
LRDVENRVVADDRRLTLVLPGLACLSRFFVLVEPLPENDGVPVLSLANLTAEFLGLFVGQPEGRLEGHAVEKKQIDAPVLFPAHQVLREPARTAPGFAPGDRAGL